MKKSKLQSVEAFRASRRDGAVYHIVHDPMSGRKDAYYVIEMLLSKRRDWAYDTETIGVELPLEAARAMVKLRTQS